MSHPYEIFGSQNVHDDDGPVIDSFLIETDAPPKPEPEPIPATPDDKPIRTTRILSGFALYDITQVEPFQLLPPDANRQQFEMRVTSQAGTPTLADYILWSDEKGKLQLPADGSLPNTGQYGRVHTTPAPPLTLDVHTGAIWVRINPLQTAIMEISWWATTK